MLAPLIILIVLLGVFPKPALDRISSVTQLVTHVEKATGHYQPSVASKGTVHWGAGHDHDIARREHHGLGGLRKIPLPSIRYLTIMPPIIMIGGAVVLLAVASLVSRPLRVRVSTIGSVVISGSALGISIWQWYDVRAHGAHTYIAHAVVMDGFSVLITMLVAVAMLLTALVADGYLKREGITGAEFHVLALVSARARWSWAWPTTSSSSSSVSRSCPSPSTCSPRSITAGPRR